jgi:hypothetical protein
METETEMGTDSRASNQDLGQPKVVHGSAVESQYIVPPRPRLGGKEFIWVTVSNLIVYLSQFFNSLPIVMA